VIELSEEDALQTMTEQFHPFPFGKLHFGNALLWLHLMQSFCHSLFLSVSAGFRLLFLFADVFLP
jgi:hypothetical protein